VVSCLYSFVVCPSTGRAKRPPFKAKLNVDLHRSQVGEIAAFVERASVRRRRPNGSARDFFPSFKTVLNKCSQRKSLDGFLLMRQSRCWHIASRRSAS